MNNIEELAANVTKYQQANIPELWRKTRILLGYGVNELAAALDTSGAQISRIESGERVPSAGLIIKFSQLKEREMGGPSLTSRAGGAEAACTVKSISPAQAGEGRRKQ